MTLRRWRTWHRARGRRQQVGTGWRRVRSHGAWRAQALQRKVTALSDAARLKDRCKTSCGSISSLSFSHLVRQCGHGFDRPRFLARHLFAFPIGESCLSATWKAECWRLQEFWAIGHIDSAVGSRRGVRRRFGGDAGGNFSAGAPVGNSMMQGASVKFGYRADAKRSDAVECAADLLTRQSEAKCGVYRHLAESELP